MWSVDYSMESSQTSQTGSKQTGEEEEEENMAAAWKKRLQKELCELQKRPPPGMKIHRESNLTKWIIELDGAQGTLYENEKFQLQFKFGSRYPFDSPEVTFVGANVPVHPHIYSNGHICLSILTEDWSPALSVESVCLSIVSMLSSCKEKKRPPDNNIYVSTCHKNPKKTRWWYHGESSEFRMSGKQTILYSDCIVTVTMDRNLRIITVI